MEQDRTFRLNFIAFFLAFGIGILFVYIKAPAPRIIVRYPTPYNAQKTVYKDSADTCFVFNANKTECPADPKKVKRQPINTDETGEN